MAEVVFNEYFKRFTNSSISANGIEVVNIPDEAVDKHKYFNDLFIINNSGAVIELYLDQDQDKAIPVPSKFAVGLTFKDDNVKYSRLTIAEISGNAINAGEVRIVVSKKKLIEVAN